MSPPSPDADDGAGPDPVVLVEPARPDRLEALIEGDAVYSARFGRPVAQGWAGFPDALPRVLAEARADPGSPWGAHLFFDGAGMLVGFGGWKGPPVAGSAELGYALAPSARGRGLATAVVRELVRRARRTGLATVAAHTLGHENPSTAVLRRCGFAVVATVESDELGPTWRWELALQ